MCGIVGLVAPRGRDGLNQIRGMLQDIAHRGPDGEGIWANEAKTVWLGHKRLAIIDVTSAADQPMHAIGNGCSIAYNGEIYNHQELRVDLERNGRRFRTLGSDTEVLLEGYLHWGLEGLLSRINGIFAFALFDHNEQKVHLVRDRSGVKPLALFRSNGSLYFSSEIKAFHSLDNFVASLDRSNLYHHLSFRSLPAPRSLFNGVEKLPPGHVLTVSVSDGRERLVRYWNPLDGSPIENITRGEAVKELARLLESSVDYQLVSDVPIGIFLSGGVDSNFLLSKTARRVPGIKSFTATYPGYSNYSEGERALEFAGRFGADHHEVPITQDDFIELLPDIAYYQDEPIAAPICVPVFMLSRAAQNAGLKVVLTGEGSDEVFCGYESWGRILRTERAIAMLPTGIAQGSAKLAGFLASKFMDASARPIEALNRIGERRPLFWGGAMDFTEEEKSRLISPDFKTDELETYEAVIAPFWQEFCEQRDERDVSAWMSYLDLNFRLPELMLPRVDKMGMARSIEGRVPFLDHRIIEFYLSLPQDIRLQASIEGKGLFKEVAAPELGKEFVYAKKRGFQAPIAEWKFGKFGNHFNGRLKKFNDDLGVFSPSGIEALLERPGDRLYFSLVNFMLWHEKFIG